MATTEDLTCAALVELVTEYLEGSLAPDERARFEEHLADCQGCTAHLDQMRRTIDVVGRLTEADVPTVAAAELLAAFRDFNRA